MNFPLLFGHSLNMIEIMPARNKRIWLYITVITLCTTAVAQALKSRTTDEKIQKILALKCRIADEKIQQDFNDVVRTCMSNIHSNSRNGDNGTGRHDSRHNSNQRGLSYTTRKPFNNRGNHQQNNKKDSYDEDEDDDSEESSSYNTRNNGRSGSRFNNRNNGYKSQFDQGGRRPNHTNFSHSNKHASSPLEDIEPCTVHCVFRQMRMLDGDSKPDKSSIVNVMTQKIRNPELKDFIRESVMDCFEIIESGMQVDAKCDFSKQFALCLEEKGQQNCEDWDDDDSKKRNSGTNNNNNANNNNNNNNREHGFMNKNNQNGKPNNNLYRG